MLPAGMCGNPSPGVLGMPLFTDGALILCPLADNSSPNPLRTGGKITTTTNVSEGSGPVHISVWLSSAVPSG